MLLCELHDSHNKEIEELVNFVVDVENGALSANRAFPISIEEFTEWCEAYCPHDDKYIDNAEDVVTALNNKWAARFAQAAQARQA